MNLSLPHITSKFFLQNNRVNELRTLMWLKKSVAITHSPYIHVSHLDIAKQLGISVRSVYRHISLLVDRGFLIKCKTPNLFCVVGKSQCEVLARDFLSEEGMGFRFSLVRVPSEILHNAEDFRLFIYFSILSENINRQAYAQMKRAGRVWRSVTTDDISGRLSCDTFGRLLGLSAMSGSRILRKLAEKGYIDLTKNQYYWKASLAEGAISGLSKSFSEYKVIQTRKGVLFVTASTISLNWMPETKRISLYPNKKITSMSKP